MLHQEGERSPPQPAPEAAAAAAASASVFPDHEVRVDSDGDWNLDFGPGAEPLSFTTSPGEERCEPGRDPP
eukprot:11209272-Lingulodinium_polyedra.AAC.1